MLAVAVAQAALDVVPAPVELGASDSCADSEGPLEALKEAVLECVGDAVEYGDIVATVDLLISAERELLPNAEAEAASVSAPLPVTDAVAELHAVGVA